MYCEPSGNHIELESEGVICHRVEKDPHSDPNSERYPYMCNDEHGFHAFFVVWDAPLRAVRTSNVVYDTACVCTLLAPIGETRFGGGGATSGHPSSIFCILLTALDIDRTPEASKGRKYSLAVS